MYSLHNIYYATLLINTLLNVKNREGRIIRRGGSRSLLSVYHPSPYHKNLKTNNFYGLFDLDFKKAKLYEPNFEIEKIASSACLISSPVAFTASSYRTIGFSHEDAPFLLLAGYLFGNKILHKKIREQGGAYGSGAKYSPSNGTITFNGFRDPHITSTLDAFNLKRFF